MAAKKLVRRRRSPTKARPPREVAQETVPRTRLRRTNDEKRAIVQQILQSTNQSAAMKEARIYPNQFYAWKKELVQGGDGPTTRRRSVATADGLVEEAQRYVAGKSSLLERLRAKRDELDALIAQLEAD